MGEHFVIANLALYDYILQAFPCSDDLYDVFCEATTKKELSFLLGQFAQHKAAGVAPALAGYLVYWSAFSETPEGGL